MCGIYDYRARRVLFAVQLQDRGEHRARYVTAYETFENVVITLFYFEQGTDENYYDCITSCAATGRASENERCGWRHNATEAAGQEAVTQGNVGDARSVLARS